MEQGLSNSLSLSLSSCTPQCYLHITEKDTSKADADDVMNSRNDLILKTGCGIIANVEVAYAKERQYR